MDHQDESPSPSTRVKLVASTGDITAGPAPATARDSRGDGDIRGYFEAAQWTADGTTLLTSSSSNEVSGYIVPADLLSARPAPHALTPSARIPLPEPSSVLAGAPYFDLSSPWTNQVLVSARDHPLQLFYLDPSTISPTTTTSSSSTPVVAASSSYPLTKDPRSETFLAATSLVWPAPGTHFVAGARSLLARYDASRAGDGPVSRIRTIPSERHLSKGGGVGMRGAVSALGHEPGGGGGLIAAGTWTRWVGLYDFGVGECVATWGIASAADDDEVGGGGGDGVTQTVWSPCGRYLVVAERKARAALVYDVRVTGRLLGWLAGREAACNQRIGCDVFPGHDDGGGFEVWSGSAGGAVRVWEGVGGREGAHEPAWGWRAHDRSAVGSACVHMSGSVVATCAGSWEFPDVEEEGDEGEGEMGDGAVEKRMPWMRRRNKESSLKIWSIEGGQGDEDDDERRGAEEEEAKLE
ncbi:hypothetical protein F4809DRAFT_651188 [Biscogniauxia mediterranea]|nr:hypothetical protein F4809DRAFT_651188 [Biscogniauxia mediterranea]